jgi:hypothetical protein
VKLDVTVNVMNMHSHLKLSFNSGTCGVFALRYVPGAFKWTNEASKFTNDGMKVFDGCREARLEVLFMFM